MISVLRIALATVLCCVLVQMYGIGAAASVFAGVALTVSLILGAKEAK